MVGERGSAAKSSALEAAEGKLRDVFSSIDPLILTERRSDDSMKSNSLRMVLQHLQQLLRPPDDEEWTDGQLLARFVAARDELAFAGLVHRHGPMVLSVCRRILQHTQDAEDAFQATFLVLARKAHSVVHRQALGSWLYRVASRIALEAKIANDKRRRCEKQMDQMPHPRIAPPEAGDWRCRLDHELSLLPERYRAVVVACDLSGMSRKEAARHLRLAEGTVSSRLARGRSLLAKRLSRYGLSLTVATLAAGLSQEATAIVPVALRAAAVLTAAGQTMVSASVGVLTKGALKAMLLTKLKWGAGVVVVAAALGVSGLAYRAAGQSASPPTNEEATRKAPSELEILRREVELLKLKMEVVQEKQRKQEEQLLALQGRAELEKLTKKDAALIQAEKLKTESARQAAVRRLQEEHLKSELQKAQSDLEMGIERANWSKKLSERKYVTEWQAEADQARLRAARRVVWRLETQMRLNDVEAAFKTLRDAGSPEAQRRAADEMDKAIKKLREQLDRDKELEQSSERPIKEKPGQPKK
jgi:RNA polymerase sigma factor (sigma-70 family)